MPVRILEILLVSSAYDAFVLEEDGSLSDRLFTAYAKFDLTAAPRMTHAETGADALRLLTARRFDMVISVVRVEDMEISEFSRRVKESHPSLPVVMLAFDESDLAHFEHGELPPSIDRAFLWTGDTRTLVAAIGLTEDTINVEADTRRAGVQIILVVEDGLRAYSTFLALLYPALLAQAGSLIDEGLNDAHKAMRLRARPKILLANSYDEGLRCFETHREHMLALISDVRFPKEGTESADAGFVLARKIRSEAPDLPILLQSTELDLAETEKLGASALDKRDPQFATRLRRFLRVSLGFGDFVFNVPGRGEVGRARNIFEMQTALRHVPIESVEYHSGRHDFSTWLRARAMFELARKVRETHLGEGGEELRSALISVIEEASRHEQEGVIADFSARDMGPSNRFVRLGRGSLGGKARSVAFLSAQIVRRELLHRFDGLEIRIPKTIVIGTDHFDAFMEQHDLEAMLSLDDASILERFVATKLPPLLRRELAAALGALWGPLAVRSSSVLEDSRYQPFAGVYATYMLPNNHADDFTRFAEVCRAIKAVYASAFCKEARTYAAGTPHLLEGQKMAVLIQQVVGQTYGQRHYPHFSGVAQSNNPYPIGNASPEDGVGVVALGLGETVVSGRAALRFSPGAPAVLPQFPTARAYLSRSQTEFFAVDLSRSTLDLTAGPEASLGTYSLADAEEDGTLRFVASVYSSQDDAIRDNLKVAGPRVVTFRNILRYREIPLAEALLDLLKIFGQSMGGDIELEFAVDMANGVSPRSKRARVPRLYLLQVRPMPSHEGSGPGVDLDRLEAADVWCSTARSLGHGRIDDIRDVVYVRNDDLSSAQTPAAAREVGLVNETLMDQQRPYVVIGAGRWGTSDPSLGVPVAWGQIAGARVIIEVPMANRHVEHSQGTHFFQNVTAHRIGYLTMAPDADPVLDWAWLEAQPAVWEGTYVRHVRFDAPMTVHLDGRAGRAALLRPLD